MDARQLKADKRLQQRDLGLGRDNLFHVTREPDVLIEGRTAAWPLANAVLEQNREETVVSPQLFPAFGCHNLLDFIFIFHIG